mmetsp:Transcript_23716/g.47273  ORF Transcript_23716/g.47273 Transcript_23716/m.47273 type:complete len:110 (-) Transcript_23716:462-791(-)
MYETIVVPPRANATNTSSTQQQNKHVVRTRIVYPYFQPPSAPPSPSVIPCGGADSCSPSIASASPHTSGKFAYSEYDLSKSLKPTPDTAVFIAFALASASALFSFNLTH